MSVVFLRIFVARAEILYGYKFVVPLRVCDKSIFQSVLENFVCPNFTTYPAVVI